MSGAAEQIHQLWGSQSPMAPGPARKAPKREGGKGESRSMRNPRPPKRMIPPTVEAESEEELQQEQPRGAMNTVLRMLARHEHALQMLEVDRSFVLHLSTRESSILPQLFRTSQEWKVRHEGGTCDSPLRTALMTCILLELQARLQKADADPLLTLSQQAGWLTSEQKWKFVAWHPQDRKLMPTTRTPTPHQDILKTVQELTQEVVKPNFVRRFHSIKPLRESYQTETVIMLLTISTRPEAAKLHNLFTEMEDLSATQLIGMQIRRERNKPGKLAEELRKHMQRR